MSVTVREATDADREPFIDMIEGLNAFESELFAAMDTSRDSAIRHFDWLQTQIRERRGFALIAESGDGPIGFLVGFVDEDDSAYILPEWREYGLISDVFVTEAARGSGAARAMVAEAEHRFAALGLRQAQIGVLAGNTGARAAYEKLGFTALAATLSKPIG